MMSEELSGLDKDAARFFFIILVAGICAVFTYLVVGD